MNFYDLSPKENDCPFLLRKKLEHAIITIAALTVEKRALEADRDAKLEGVIKLFGLFPQYQGPTA
jgi:hypothetical protein